ncbi:hypothetical protein Cni_G07279 [Canna indica]|uniref:Transcription repressor n=1 Tax=Canna indica TaxID=4628 RepID=A0AAQ3K0T8_9LILI|nr:hypothetical protein Cni_G07279 [Canna indica]
MEKSINKSTKLKHRFTRMLLRSSCTATIAATEAGGAQTRPSSAALHRRVAPVVHVSINCGARRSVEASEPLIPLPTRKEEEKETNAQRRKIDLERNKSSGRLVEKKKSLFDAYEFTSSSSMDSEDDELDLFSSDGGDEKETATLLSSKSFSSDSSEFYRRSRKNKSRNTRSKVMKSTRWPPRRQEKHSGELRPLISAEKEEKAGFAVVKRSTDPYSDFRSSMVEMIVERGMSKPRDLERLLDSYLTLNSLRHHEFILEAFADICEAMFGK